MSGAHVERQRCQFTVPLKNLICAVAAAVPAREAQGQYSLSLPTASTAFAVGIPLSSVMPWVVSAAAGVDRFGFKLEELVLQYSIGTTDLTANTITLNQETIAGAAARAAATTFGGTLTYDTDDGTSAAMGLTQRANLYKTRVILGTPTYLLGQGQVVTAEWTLTNGGASGTSKIHNVELVGRFGLYY